MKHTKRVVETFYLEFVNCSRYVQTFETAQVNRIFLID